MIADLVGSLEQLEKSWKVFEHNGKPSKFDYDDVILCKDYVYHLKAVYDGFDEICNRIKKLNSQK